MSQAVGAKDRADTPPLDELVRMYSRMVLIRTFEQSSERLHVNSKLSGPFHSSMGQEAVAVGVCSALREDDVITSTHRGHGHLLAKGAQMPQMLAELGGRTAGLSAGRAGSMHLADLAIGAIGENGIVGASIFLGVGAALGFQLEGVDRVSVAFFGDGAVGQGVLYECLNLAAIWQLPVVFVCEDNQYAHSFASRRLANGGDITRRAETFGIPARLVDGIDALEVRRAAEEAAARARAGDGATVIQARCYRWRGHNIGDGDHLYRPKEEVREARKRDPLDVMRAHIQAIEPSVDFEAIRTEAERAFVDAWSYVESSEVPGPEVVFRDLPA